MSAEEAIESDIRWTKDEDLVMLHGVTDGAFEAEVTCAIPSSLADSVEINFDAPRGRGREFAERVYAFLKELR